APFHRSNRSRRSSTGAPASPRPAHSSGPLRPIFPASQLLPYSDQCHAKCLRCANKGCTPRRSPEPYSCPPPLRAIPARAAVLGALFSTTGSASRPCSPLEPRAFLSRSACCLSLLSLPGSRELFCLALENVP